MRALVTYTLQNILGHVLPLVIALAAVPVCVGAYGTDRFGLLSLAWMLLGYFAFFDLGLGRATTHAIARARSDGHHARIGAVLRVSLALNLAVGIVGGAALLVAADPLVRLVFSIPAALAGEAHSMVTILGWSIPMITATAVLRGALEADQRFGWVNAVKIPSNGLIFLLPMIGAWMGWDLPFVALLMTLSRMLTTLAFGTLVARVFPSMLSGRLRDRAGAGGLLRFGGWVTVSNLVNPLVTYGERLLIVSTLGLTMLTYYSAPYEFISRLAVVPASLSLSLFPMISAVDHPEAGAVWESLILFPSRLLILLFVPVGLLFILFAPEVLELWLGSSFRALSTIPLILLTGAMVLNALAYVPLAAVQGLGRPDLKAKLDLGELLLFGILAWCFVSLWGIGGAALAKLVINAVDMGVLFLFARTMIAHRGGNTSMDVTLPLWAAILLGGAMLLVLSVDPRLWIRGLLFVLTVGSFGWLAWTRGFTRDERHRLLGWWKARTA